MCAGSSLASSIKQREMRGLLYLNKLRKIPGQISTRLESASKLSKICKMKKTNNLTGPGSHQRWTTHLSLLSRWAANPCTLTATWATIKTKDHSHTTTMMSSTNIIVMFKIEIQNYRKIIPSTTSTMLKTFQQLTRRTTSLMILIFTRRRSKLLKVTVNCLRTITRRVRSTNSRII